MMMKLYSMFDNKVDIFNKPIFVKDEEEMKRFISLVGELKEINPIDYEVYELGEFDTDSGKFSELAAPKHLYSVGQLMNMKIENYEQKGEENVK